MSESQESVDSVNESSTEESIQDPIKNVKAEMDRKFSNITKQLEEQNRALMQQLQSFKQPVQPQVETKPKVDLSELAYTDPEAYAEEIAKRVSSRVDNKLSQSNAINSTLAQLTTEYPELNDANSEMHIKAIKIFDSLSAEEKASPSGVKLAIREAAADLGIVPASKRKKKVEDNDDYSFGGGMSESNNSSNRNNNGKVKLDPKTIELARLLGRNVEDPKVRARLEKAAKRDYKKYQGE